MIHTIGNCNSGTCHLQLQPNRPMNWHGSQRAWLWLSLPPFILAVLLAAQGLWPVLPFAGLEMLLLYAAFYVSSRRQFGEEQLCVEEHKVLIRIRRGECVREQCLPRAWTRLQVVPGGATLVSEPPVSGLSRPPHRDRCRTHRARAASATGIVTRHRPADHDLTAWRPRLFGSPTISAPASVPLNTAGPCPR